MGKGSSWVAATNCVEAWLLWVLAVPRHEQQPLYSNPLWAFHLCIHHATCRITCIVPSSLDVHLQRCLSQARSFLFLVVCCVCCIVAPAAGGLVWRAVHLTVRVAVSGMLCPKWR
jgi:hypothetical protein